MTTRKANAVLKSENPQTPTKPRRAMPGNAMPSRALPTTPCSALQRLAPPGHAKPGHAVKDSNKQQSANGGKPKRMIPPKIRAQAFERSNNICQFCGMNPAKEAHHWHYPEYEGKELKADDLTALCRQCHEIATNIRRGILTYRMTKSEVLASILSAIKREIIRSWNTQLLSRGSRPSSCTPVHQWTKATISSKRKPKS